MGTRLQPTFQQAQITGLALLENYKDKTCLLILEFPLVFSNFKLLTR